MLSQQLQRQGEREMQNLSSANRGSRLLRPTLCRGADLPSDDLGSRLKGRSALPAELLPRPRPSRALFVASRHHAKSPFHNIKHRPRVCRLRSAVIFWTSTLPDLLLAGLLPQVPIPVPAETGLMRLARVAQTAFELV